MKKGMTVEIDNGLKFNLVDSVTYAGEKYFAATADDENDDTLYFFKLIVENNEESLELLDSEESEKVIDALSQHISNTF